MKKGIAPIWLTVLILSLILTSCGPTRKSEPIAAPREMTGRDVLQGEKLFMFHCNQCHPRGEAGLAPALNNKPLPGFLIRFVVRTGPGPMPKFSEKEISKKGLDEIVAYLKALRKNRS